jgi:hypothetical protein
MYAPWLAWGIHVSNQEVELNTSTTNKPYINLKGFIAMNAVADF